MWSLFGRDVFRWKGRAGRQGRASANWMDMPRFLRKFFILLSFCIPFRRPGRNALALNPLQSLSGSRSAQTKSTSSTRQISIHLSRVPCRLSSLRPCPPACPPKTHWVYTTYTTAGRHCLLPPLCRLLLMQPLLLVHPALSSFTDTSLLRDYSVNLKFVFLPFECVCMLLLYAAARTYNPLLGGFIMNTWKLIPGEAEVNEFAFINYLYDKYLTFII